MLSKSPYKRYITRWNLEKKNPTAKLSKPKEPIVFWIENTVPYNLGRRLEMEFLHGIKHLRLRGLLTQ